MAPYVKTDRKRKVKKRDNVGSDDQSNQNNVKRYEANDDSGKRPGKKHIDKNDDKPEVKDIGRRICSLCNKSMLTGNFTRHLRKAHKIETEDEVKAYSFQASCTGRAGMRPVWKEDLPSILTDNWKIWLGSGGFYWTGHNTNNDKPSRGPPRGKF